MKKIIYLVAVMLTLTTFANAQEADKPKRDRNKARANTEKAETSEREKINARTAELTSTWNSGDYDGYLAIYDEEFMVISEGSKPLTDREEYRQDLAGEISVYTPLKYESKSLKIHGNYAYELGMDSYDYEGDDGKTVTDHEDYLVVWKKDKEGAWKIQVDLFWESYTDEENTESVTKALVARRAEFIEYWKNKDGEGALSVYDKEIIMIADGRKPLLDRKAWGETLAEEVKEITDFGLMPASVKVHDGYAYEVGTFTYTMEEVGKGEYVFVWKQDDKGVWHILVEAWWDPSSDDDDE